MSNPYAYYDNKLGFKIKFLTSDRCAPNSIGAISYNALYKRMKSNTCAEQQLCRASLNMDALIEFNSLSREWKDIITSKFGSPKKEIKKSWFAQHYVADREAGTFFTAHRYGKNNDDKLDLKLIEQYIYNASVLNTVLEVKENRKAYAKALGGVRIDIWDSLSRDVNAFREVPHNLPATKDGLRRKATIYQKQGYKSLISRKLKNSNAKKVAGKEQMALLDELLAKHTNLDNEIVASIYNTVCQNMGWKTITAMTVSNRKNKSKLVTHAGRQGIKSLKNNVLMQVKRKRPSAPMLYWTIDGWDAELLYQDTKIDEKGHTRTTYHNRLTVVVVLDPHNNYPVGYAIGTHETPQLIKQALCNAMQHVRSLYGALYMPYQLQTDNYAIKSLKPLYNAITPHFTPAESGNAKAKVIEPYFNEINKKYCKLLNNWSGHNVNSGSKNQPNTEHLQKIKKDFPDQRGAVSQIDSLMSAERSKKVAAYLENWGDTQEQYRQIMTLENYLLTFGDTTGHTNKLRGEGLKITIDGQKYTYDSFDINFRHKAHLNWEVRYDNNNLDQVLAVSTDGSERFILEQKYIQPMAIADRVEGDTDQLRRVREFNKSTTDMIIEQRSNNADLLMPLMEMPALEDTLAKHLLTDSLGQHKNNRNKQRLADNKIAFAKAKRIETKHVAKEEKKVAKTFADQREEYYKSTVNINDYI